MEHRTVRVPAISCGHCVKTIERELGELQGVTRVRASEGERTVEISWQDPATWASIRALLEEIHYPPEET